MKDDADSAAIYFPRMVLRTGPFDGVRDKIDCKRPRNWLLGNDELAFLGDPLESFRRTLDPVLAVVALSRKLADHLIGAARGGPRNVARGKVDGRSDRKLVLQRPLHHTKAGPR